MLTHACFTAAIEIHRERLDMLSDRDSSVCFLPLCHIFERAWILFLPLHLSIPVAINNDPNRIQQTLRERHPTCMCSVPRFWEKVYTVIESKMAEMNPLRRFIARRAQKVGPSATSTTTGSDSARHGFWNCATSSMTAWCSRPCSG